MKFIDPAILFLLSYFIFLSNLICIFPKYWFNGILTIPIVIISCILAFYIANKYKTFYWLYNEKLLDEEEYDE